MGTAPGVPIYSIKSVDSLQDTSLERIFCALDKVYFANTSGGSADDINVANYNWGFREANTTEDCTSGFQSRICSIYDLGVHQVAAAGNLGISFEANRCDPAGCGIQIPTTYPQVLTVTGIADTDGTGGGAGPTCNYTDPETGEAFTDNDDTYWNLSNFAVTQADRNHTIAAVAGCARMQQSDGTIVTDHGNSFAAHPPLQESSISPTSTGAWVTRPARATRKFERMPRTARTGPRATASSATHATPEASPGSTGVGS